MDSEIEKMDDFAEMEDIEKWVILQNYLLKVKLK